MYKVTIIIILLTYVHFSSYAQTKAKSDKQKFINEILTIEKKFMDDLKTSGVEYAFFQYAAPDAVIKRGNDSLIKGSMSIKNFYSNPVYKNAIAEWSPDYVDVSNDGSMAYTYGRYKWIMKDDSGKLSTYEGVFHTVWKKMKDGSWKYVWD